MAKIKKKNVLLLQPHSDDILFSCSKFLFERENYGDVVIMTMENGNSKRVAEDIALCELFNVRHETLDEDYEDTSYYEYYKRFKTFKSEECIPILEDLYGIKFLKNLRKKLRIFVKEYLENDYLVVTCLGIGQPMHHFLMENTKDLAHLFYRDFPHSYKRKTQECFNSKIGFELVEEFFSEEEHSMKFDIAKKIYKTQSSLLFFEKGYIDKKLPEQFYTLKV